MAINEKSGFFDANELSSGQYDPSYFAKDFAKYFSLFIGNGVFINPTNQLKVVAGSGLKVIVKEGWAFINGYWYHNEKDKEIIVLPNVSGLQKIDSIVLRLNTTTGGITAEYKENSVSVSRTSPTYELQLATINVPVGVSQISDSYITDKRSDESVCGFVKSTVETLETKELFKQFESAFNVWFDEVKGSLSGDVASNLQNQINDLKDAQEIVLGTSWSGKKQTINVPGIKSTDRPIIYPKLSMIIDDEQNKTINKEFAKIVNSNTLNGKIEFLCSEPTTTNITLIVKGV